jgi:hypothetical protein
MDRKRLADISQICQLPVGLAGAYIAYRTLNLQEHGPSGLTVGEALGTILHSPAFILILGAFIGLTLVAFISAVSGRLARKANVGVSVAQESSQPTLEATGINELLKVADDDDSRMEQRLIVTAHYVTPVLEAPDPYVDLFVSVLNASVYSAVFDRVEGQLTYRDHPLQQSPTLTVDAALYHGGTGLLRFRQSLSRDVVQGIMSAASATLRADNVRVWFSYKNRRHEKKQFAKIFGGNLFVMNWTASAAPKDVKPNLLLEEIRFDYMPGSPLGDPLANGWKIAYGGESGQPPEFSIEQDPRGQDGLEMQAHPGYAIQFLLGRATAAATQTVKLSIRYSDTAMFWLLVQLASKRGTRTVNRQMKIELQGGNPRPPEQHPDFPSEQIVRVPGDPLGNGWVALDLDVVQLAEAAWGQQGWVHDTLLGIRLRGNVAVSPISMIRTTGT